MCVVNATMRVAESRDWCDLPIDIMRLIINRLSGRDAESFREVCHTWSLVERRPITCHWTQESPSIHIPSLIIIGQDSSQLHLYDPMHNTAATMDTPELGDAARIRSSKDGWLIMSQGKCKVFFFNPFTMERINLPDVPDHYSFQAIAFSSVPTSPDCVVFAVTSSYGSVMDFSFIRHGEDTWQVCFIDNNYEFWSCSTSPVFHNGVFYCLDKDGKLGVFDPIRAVEEEEDYGWTVLASPKKLACNSIKRSYLLEINGDLVLVLEGHIGKWVKVFKLDDSLMTWKRLTNLDNGGMLFLSNVASLGVTVTNKTLQVLGMENKIYYPRFYNHDCVFHSLTINKFVTFRDGYAPDDGWYDALDKINCAWIEPSFEVHDHETLQWYDVPLSRCSIVKNNNSPLLYPSVRIPLKRDRDIVIRGRDIVKRDDRKEQPEEMKRSLPPIPRLDPWLVFIHGKKGQQTFRSISENSHHVKNIPEMRHKIVCTCSHGWLVLLSKRRPSSDCLLLNPVSMDTIQLPKWNFDEDHSCCALSLPPNDPNSQVLFTLKAKRGFVRIVYCRPGDKDWIVTKLKMLEGDMYLRKVAVLGGKFYGITLRSSFAGGLVIIDLIATPCIRKVAYLPEGHLPNFIAHEDILVESCGELFYVNKIYRDIRQNVEDFEVFKMDFGENAWVDVKSLDGRAFFLGDYGCLSCSANEQSGVDENTIYFIETADRNLYEFNLNKKDIRASVPCPNVISEWSTPAWILPLL